MMVSGALDTILRPTARVACGLRMAGPDCSLVSYGWQATYAVVA